jgi:hypothetical protein
LGDEDRRRPSPQLRTNTVHRKACAGAGSLSAGLSVGAVCPSASSRAAPRRCGADLAGEPFRSLGLICARARRRLRLGLPLDEARRTRAEDAFPADGLLPELRDEVQPIPWVVRT